MAGWLVCRTQNRTLLNSILQRTENAGRFFFHFGLDLRARNEKSTKKTAVVHARQFLSVYSKCARLYYYVFIDREQMAVNVAHERQRWHDTGGALKETKENKYVKRIHIQS